MTADGPAPDRAASGPAGDHSAARPAPDPRTRAAAAPDAGRPARDAGRPSGRHRAGDDTIALAGEPVIRLTSAAYTYRGPPPVAALKPTTLVIYRGEHVAITGPSGSGKSTLLNLLGLLDKPTQGSIEIDGINVGAASERERASVRAHRIGFVFQSFHLLPYRTSIENVMLAQVYADEPRRRRRAAAMAALTQVGLAHRAHALPTALSGGERQRVAIARALVNRPSMLMCDEPTGNLDTATTVELTDLLESLHHDGATLVVITHNPVVASRAQRQIAIRDGELTELAPGAFQPPAGAAHG